MRPLHFSTVTPTASTPLGVASSYSEAATLLVSSQDSWLAISTTADGGDDEIESFIGEAEREESLLGIIPREVGFQWLVNAVGPALACAVTPPQEAGILLLSKPLISGENALRSVSDAIWDLVLRSISKGHRPHARLQSFLPTDSAALPKRDAELPALAPSSPHRQLNWLREHLLSMRLAATAGSETSRVEQLALRAGLLQLHDLLDESHQCSQQIEHEGRDRNGDYWHAIMHRREPDYSNSKYWFRSVGRHPIFPQVAALAATALIESGSAEADRWLRKLGAPNQWDPFAFVDLCEAVESDADPALGQAAKRIQRAEQLLLLAHTANAASAS